VRCSALAGDVIKEITAFVSPAVFPRFGLPPELPAPGAP
jgi:hypothetical protein